MAILRYCGKLGSLYPSDPLASLKVDEIMDTCADIITKCPQEKDEATKKAKREEFADGPMKIMFEFLEFAARAEGTFLAGKTSRSCI